MEKCSLNTNRIVQTTLVIMTNYFIEQGVKFDKNVYNQYTKSYKKFLLQTEIQLKNNIKNTIQYIVKYKKKDIKILHI